MLIRPIISAGISGCEEDVAECGEGPIEFVDGDSPELDGEGLLGPDVVPPE